MGSAIATKSPFTAGPSIATGRAIATRSTATTWPAFVRISPSEIASCARATRFLAALAITRTTFIVRWVLKLLVLRHLCTRLHAKFERRLSHHLKHQLATNRKRIAVLAQKRRHPGARKKDRFDEFG